MFGKRPDYFYFLFVPVCKSSYGQVKMNCADSIYFSFFLVFPNHQDKTNPIKKTCKIKLRFCLIILVTKILCHSNIHKLYTLNCLFPHTIIYICLIITINSFVVKGDGKFLPFSFSFFFGSFSFIETIETFLCHLVGSCQLQDLGAFLIHLSDIRDHSPGRLKLLIQLSSEEDRSGKKNRRGLPLLVCK